MESLKLAYVFTNGLYANLVILFNNNTDEIDTETLNERVLNEVLLPNEWDSYYHSLIPLVYDNKNPIH